ncbi:MAG: M1 family metallopeptidase [Cyclobacteriaceae bacterium]|nr:M1 family metallopeptidase [Cyclobacteriaceae bacterium]
MKWNRKIITALVMGAFSFTSFSQENDWNQKFEQLGTSLPTPNEYRNGAGAPGEKYWQQKADYIINVEVNDETQVLTGSETINYFNNSPHTLAYLWVQLDQNVRAKGNLSQQTSTRTIRDSTAAKFIESRLGLSDYEGGYKISAVKDTEGKDLKHTINRTMMRIDMDKPLKSGEQFKFSIDWSYNIYDRMNENGRGGYEYFPEDDNYAYTCAQWFPRMAVYDDVNGWQNKQFIGRGEFALTFGDYTVNITVPSDHIVAATGSLQNPDKVLTKTELSRFNQAKKSFDKPVIIVTQEEATAKEKIKSTKKSTWTYKAINVRDFAFASSRKYIWDAQAVKLNTKTPLAMSYYPKEANPLWETESTLAIKNTLEVYSERTIEYPYPVAISVSAANQGMEYPMICFNYGRPKADGTISPRLRAGNIGVIVHEVGHNFFPMIINSDERQWTWMDEGLNSFLERETKRLRYPDLDITWGSPKGITRYMKGDKSNIRPIMTNSEQIKQFGYNAYGKPSSALTLLRETVMGPELFDAAFKEYATRWAFKHPMPADFFRSMEDASAVDLDWFWKGWFFSTDYVDVSVEDVKWFRLKEETHDPERKAKKVKKGDLNTSTTNEEVAAIDFSNGFEEITVIDTDPRFYGEFQNRVDDNAIRTKLANKNMYEIKFKNKGGLVTPLIVEFTFTDGSKQLEKIPAEIWRYNENQVSKVFILDKEVTNIVLDPEAKTADTNLEDNVFPKIDVGSKLDKYKEDK